MATSVRRGTMDNFPAPAAAASSAFACSSMPNASTLAPPWARRIAQALPIPLVPVTSATLPSKSILAPPCVPIWFFNVIYKGDAITDAKCRAMKAVRLESVHHLYLRDVTKPTPGPDELLVKVEAAGVCGSDRHFMCGEFPCSPPVTLGHEFCGIIECVGGAVAGFHPGMLA